MNLDDFGRPSLGHGLASDLAVVDDPQSRLLPNAEGVRRSKMSVVRLKLGYNVAVKLFQIRTLKTNEGPFQNML